MSKDPDDMGADCLRGLDLSSAEYATGKDRIKNAIQDAFEIGFKAAGGAICPDVPSGFGLVELSLDRDEIDALAHAAESAASLSVNNDARPHLMQFLEKISIFRRKKP